MYYQVGSLVFMLVLVKQKTEDCPDTLQTSDYPNRRRIDGQVLKLTISLAL